MYYFPTLPYIYSFFPTSKSAMEKTTNPHLFFFSAKENLVQTRKFLAYVYGFVSDPPQMQALHFWIYCVRLFSSLIKTKVVSFLECSRVSWHPQSHSQQNLRTTSETLKYFFFLHLERTVPLLFFSTFITFPVFKLCCAKNQKTSTFSEN